MRIRTALAQLKNGLYTPHSTVGKPYLNASRMIGRIRQQFPDHALRTFACALVFFLYDFYGHSRLDIRPDHMWFHTLSRSSLSLINLHSMSFHHSTNAKRIFVQV